MKKTFILACAVMCIAMLGACTAAEPTKEEQQTNESVFEQSSAAASAAASTILYTATTALPPEDEWVVQNRVIPKELQPYEPGSIKLWSEEEIFGELTLNTREPVPLFYRYCYYNSHGSYWTLVDLDFGSDADAQAYAEWLATLPRIEDFYPNGTAQEMPLVTLVKRFQVPKHVFVAEVERDRKRFLSYGYDLSDEIHELPNADIIYTFDNDIINAYYRRDQ